MSITCAIRSGPSMAVKWARRSTQDRRGGEMETHVLEERSDAPARGLKPAVCRMLRMYKTMLRIRTFEECVAEMVETHEARTPCHLYIGQEAIATGVCEALRAQDTIWGGHRSHGHYLAKGGDARAMLAEILARSSGCSGGRGGSMHLYAGDVGVLGTVPIVAGTVPLAVGAALANKLRGDGGVAVAFFGDGTIEEGHVHESLNLATIYGLPVIFVCENNLYASHMHLSERRRRDNIFEAGRFYGMPSDRYDGNDVLTVYRAAAQAVRRARAGGGPSFLEMRTFRWRGHVGASWDIDVGVQRRGELQQWLPKDPVARARHILISHGVADAVLAEIQDVVGEEVASARKFARESAQLDGGRTLEHVFYSSKEAR